MTKYLFTLLFFVSLSLSCTSQAPKNIFITGSTPNYRLTYTRTNKIHPVVIKVFDEFNIYPRKIDIINNEYFSDYIYTSNFGARLRYTVFVELKNNTVKVRLTDFQQFSIRKSKWINEDRLAFFDTDYLQTKIIKRLKAILNHKKLYNEARDQTYNNLLFHYLVIKNLSKSDASQWVKDNMKPHAFSLQVTLSEFKLNKTKVKTDKKYIVEFTNAGKSHLSDNFIIKYYTNNKQFAELDQQTKIFVRGKLFKNSSSNDIADLLLNNSHIRLTDSIN